MLVQFVHTVKPKGIEENIIGGPPGLGDVLRGILCFLQLKDTLNYNFKINTYYHPMYKYLEFDKEIMINEPIEGNIREMWNIDVSVDMNKNVDYVFSGGSPDAYNKIITQEHIFFLKRILTPCKSLETKLINIFNKFNLVKGDYNVLHIRINDNIFDDTKHTYSLSYRNESNYTIDHDKINLFLLSNKIDLIVTNFNELGLELQNKFGISYHSSNKVHLGNPVDDFIEDSLIDLFLLGYSKNIFSYSTYHWASGFSTMIGIAYNIPVRKI
jgi:hypothetical protein